MLRQEQTTHRSLYACHTSNRHANSKYSYRLAFFTVRPRADLSRKSCALLSIGSRGVRQRAELGRQLRAQSDLSAQREQRLAAEKRQREELESSLREEVEKEKRASLAATQEAAQSH